MSDAATMGQQGSLSSGFNIASGIKWAVVGLASFAVFGYVDNFIFDPFFFDSIHDTSNATSQAFKALLTDNFGWLHDLSGLTGDWGLLQMDWAQAILEPYYFDNGMLSPDDPFGSKAFSVNDVDSVDYLYEDPNEW